MKITLTPQQKLRLEQMHNIERDSRECDRIKAVLLASEGWSLIMISQALRIHESTVARHLSDYVLSKKLKPENGGSQSKLSASQTMHLIEHLSEKTYSHTHQIVTYVKEAFGLDYTVSGMKKWLHHLHIILDGAGYHRSDLVKDAAFILNIELHYLPPYSSNLNPIERLWKVMTEKSRNNIYFKAAIDQFFTVTLPELAGSLVSRINDNF